MPDCVDCGEHFPNKIWIGDKQHTLHHRTRCLECLPFGKRKKTRPDGTRICQKCKKVIPVYQIHYTKFCYVCYQKLREERRRDKVHKIVGEKCWLCGYGGGPQTRSVLDFHHMNPSEKKFSLTIRNMTNLAWKRVLKEMRKCALLCCRCHREYELNLISQKKVERIYKTKWSEPDKT